VLAAAVTVAPATGNIWETLISPGQQVHRGQELLRVLDCDRAVVTAVVSEAVYNRLQVGSSARFLQRCGREELVGRVTRMTSASAPPSSFAVRPSALGGETYRVTVSVPKIAEGGELHSRPHWPFEF
jgi:multidrug resistance efflux pump